MVAAGHLDGYWEVHLSPWDVAAGACIVREAGGTVTDLAGGEDWLHGERVAASNGRVHAQLLAAVGDRAG
jgi:myo-inositol-1(or 4)-monophosphatase